MASNFDSGMNVKAIYQSVIDDVIRNIRDAVFDEGYDDQFIKELKTIWEAKLNANAAKLFQNSETDYLKAAMQQQQQSRVILTHHSSSPMNLLQGGYRIQPTPTKIINLPLNKQIDGNNDNDSSDDDAKTNNNNDDVQIASSPDPFDPSTEEDDDDYGESNKKFDDEDPVPINSGDDNSDDDPQEVFETNNIVICQYEKLSRVKHNWKFQLKDGIMNLNGRDFLFSKATGDASWM